MIACLTSCVIVGAGDGAGAGAGVEKSGKGESYPYVLPLPSALQGLKVEIPGELLDETSALICAVAAEEASGAFGYTLP